MRILGLLLVREEDLRSFGMDLDPLSSLISLFLFLTFNATSIVLLDLKISCSSGVLDERIQAFLEIKNLLAVYSWLIITLSWVLTVAIFTRIVPIKLKMRARKYFYITSSCSIVYVITGGLNTLILIFSQGRIISCEISGWKDLLPKFLQETLSYLLSFPSVLVPALSLLSIIWFTLVLFKVHQISLGMSKLESFYYSLGFTSAFILISTTLILFASLVTLSLLSL
ncbi:MAG: hypothetical protein NZ992_02030 [Candidatus Korarchaeum sp.]|nr:hypothetical protein [Candidatus Korarchaeum sp.]